MVNLQTTKSIGKRIALSTCLVAFLSGNAVPLASANSYYSGVEENSAGYTYEEPITVEAEPSRNVTLKGEVSLAKGDQKVAVSLRDSDVKQVLRMFADKAGLNVVFHESVSGKITLDLVNVTLNNAFNMVMQMAELTYSIEDDTLMVASASAAEKLNFTREAMSPIEVNYLDANLVATFLNKNIFTKSRPGLSNTEVAVANPRENEVLIFGSKNDLEVAKKVVSEIDKPLRVTSYKVNHTTPKEMATLICDTWLKEKGTEGDELDENSDSEIIVGGGVIACTVDGDAESQGELESLEGQGLKVAYFPTQGVVKLYGGTVKQAEEMKRLIADADKKQPQAMLEMSIVELNESGSRTINNTWTIYSRFFTGTLGGSTGVGTTDELRPFVVTGLRDFPNHEAKFYDFKDTSEKPTPIKMITRWNHPPLIAANINWVIRNGNGRVLSTPKVMITSGQESEINLTSDYVSSVSTQYLDNGSMTPQVQRTYNISNDNGMKITLIPFISPDGYVSLNIKPEYATIKDTVQNEFGDTAATLLQRRNLDLKNIRVKDGETLILGGLVQETETKTIVKPPVLGDIPGIGWLFRSTGSTKEKSELVIMLTPHIIKDVEDLTQDTNIEAL
ncbi:secretin and TonB N-terminal domain-containing protein [bacterium]|nr:secretin and TonB N-terminal domain-containing protein [bacterium]